MVLFFNLFRLIELGDRQTIGVVKDLIPGLLGLLLLAAPAEVQAQFGYTTNPDNTIAITNYSGPGGAVAIPSSIGGLAVTAIRGSLIPSGNFNQIISAFSRCPDLTSITIPETVTRIEPWAFFACSNLVTITVPTNVTNIGDGAFDECAGLTNLTIANGVSSIGQNAFRYCTNLTSITIPDSVTTIGGDAFESCYSLTNALIGSGVISIGSFAFRADMKLEGVYFTGSAPRLGPGRLFDGDHHAIVYYPPNTTGWTPTFGGCPTMLFQP